MRRLARTRAMTPALIVAALLAWPTGTRAQEPIINLDSTVAVTLPYTFMPVLMNAEATLQFADSVSESYFLVLSEEKDDLVGWNLTRHSMITMANILVNASSPEVVGPVNLEIDGHPAVQYVIHGEIQGTRISYLHTTIDAPNLFVQVLAWSLRSDWADNEALLKDLTSTVEVMRPWRRSDVSVFDIVPGTWTWLSNEDGCTAGTQTFAIADDRETMTITHSEPFEDEDGTMKSLTNYIIDGHAPLVLHTFITDETRVTDAGVPVEWDLVAIARNRITWHRTDWPEGAYTGMLRKCPDV